MAEQSQVGKAGWMDLTVEDAPAVRDFYAAVVGWEPQPVSMGDYSDFNMALPESGEPVAGVCHARGSNAGLPPVWLVYWVVADLEASVEACRQGGGEVVAGPRGMGGQGRYAVLRDPAGAPFALYEAAGG